MTYEVRESRTSVATCDTMAEALAIVRQRLEGMAPYQAAMSELAIVKRDARGRVRREVLSRDLVALALGKPRSDLFPSELGWEVLDDAVAAGWPIELAIVPEGAGHERDRWTLVARIERPGADGITVPESAILWVARSRREVEDAMRQAEKHLPQPPHGDPDLRSSR